MALRSGIGLKRPAVLGIALLASLVPYVADATLGEPASSVATDAQSLKASVKSTPQTNYRIDEISLPSGTTLREFSTPGGSVFAVAWSGPAIPDLKQTLGSYFDSFVAGAKASRTGHHHLQISGDKFVMQSSGRMRAFNGRAYLPQAVPAGVSLDELH